MNWKNVRVLVTGADGFIGSHLAERLHAEGAQVRAFVQYNQFSSFGWLDKCSQELLREIEIVPGDVRDTGQVMNAVQDCQVVFHLAALISVPYSYKAPSSFFDTNVGGTLNVLQAARTNGDVIVVQASSSEVYGTPLKIPIHEDHPLQAQSPYAASKIACDKLAESFYFSYGVPVIILRPFNTYGPRQSARAVLPTILAQLLSGREEIHLGALFPRRDMTFVDDTVTGFLMAAGTQEAFGRTVHLGTGRAVSVRELAELAMDVLDVKARVVSTEERLRPAKSEVDCLLSDPSLAASLLGWSHQVALEDGIRRTAVWLRDRLQDHKYGQYLI